ncbi:hypothetical protein GJU41_04495 [Bacillus idriensis]|uniref:Uncharacterized protein n=1 Tax=Metabacillus idriensis TaxID=324768 RepID=A0A6I2M532_9BACI|nr:hypothetical protein [Metabacillus idriensis]
MRKKNWYLQIDEGRDVIEGSAEGLDIFGCDLKKALKLLKKSNSSLKECFILLLFTQKIRC